MQPDTAQDADMRLITFATEEAAFHLLRRRDAIMANTKGLTDPAAIAEAVAVCRELQSMARELLWTQ